MERALITSTGSVAADIVIKGLRKMGFHIIGCNMFPREWIVESCEVDKFYKISPIKEKDNYLNELKNICLKEKIDYILPMIDYEIDILNENRDWFQEHNVILCISPKSTIEIIRNKKVFQEFVAKECPSINVIPTKYLRDVIIPDWEFPVVCKPYDGRSSQGLAFIYNEKEWERFKSIVNIDKYIVEPFINGPRVVVEVVRSGNPSKVVAMTRREIISTSNGCSLTVYVYQNKILEEHTKELADKLNVLGDVNFEYILDEEGKYHIIECNPRFSAGCEFACIAGYDCIGNHMKCFKGEAIEDYDFKQSMIIARKYEEVVTATNMNLDWFNTIT